MNHPSREEFLEILRQRCKFKPKIKTIPVEKSLGRTLACDVFSRRDIPAARSSALDGIAFKFECYADIEIVSAINNSGAL